MAGAARVVHFSSVHKIDDVRIFLKECRTLAAAGYDVTLIARGATDDVIDGVHRIGVRDVRGGRLGRMIGGIAKVASLAWRQHADLYHFHDPELLPVGILFRIAGKRVVYDAHESIRDQVLSKPWVKPGLRKPISLCVGLIEDLAVRTFNGVIAATPAIASVLGSSRATVIGNFPVESEIVANEILPEREANVVLFTGGLSRIRGAVEMLRAMELVNRTRPAELHVMGAIQPSIENQLEAEPGWVYVRYMGMRPRRDVMDAMLRATCGLCVYLPEPNHVEAQPNKIFEYMGAGLAVVASHFSLWKELVQDAGVFVDPEDPASIASGILTMLADPAAAQRMGQSGLQRVRAQYTWESTAEGLLALYERVVAGAQRKVDA